MSCVCEILSLNRPSKPCEQCYILYLTFQLPGPESWAVSLTVYEPSLVLLLFCNHLRKGLSVPCWTPQKPGLSTSDNRLYLALVRVYDRHAWWWVLCLFRRSGGDPQWRAPDALRSSSAPCLSKHAASAHSGTAQMYVPLLFYFFYFIFSFKAIITYYLVNFTSSLFSQFFSISGYNLGFILVKNYLKLLSVVLNISFLLYDPFVSSNLINLKYISYLVSLTTLQFVFLLTPWETFGTSYGFMCMILFTIILDNTTLLLLWAFCFCFSSIS